MPKARNDRGIPPPVMEPRLSSAASGGAPRDQHVAGPLLGSELGAERFRTPGAVELSAPEVRLEQAR